MRDNATEIGDLVRLNQKGIEYYVYKDYYIEIISSYGIVVGLNKTNARVWWVSYPRNSLWVAKRYLKKMNKR